MRGTVCGLKDFPNALMKSADLCPRTQLLTFLCYSPTPEESFTRLISKETRGFFFFNIYFPRGVFTVDCSYLLCLAFQ